MTRHCAGAPRDVAVNLCATLRLLWAWCDGQRRGRPAWTGSKPSATRRAAQPAIMNSLRDRISSASQPTKRSAGFSCTYSLPLLTRVRTCTVPEDLSANAWSVAHCSHSQGHRNIGPQFFDWGANPLTFRWMRKIILSYMYTYTDAKVVNWSPKSRENAHICNIHVTSFLVFFDVVRCGSLSWLITSFSAHVKYLHITSYI